VEQAAFQEIIDATQLMNLAVHDQQGPWAATVFYLYHQGSFYYVSSASSRHTRATEVAATIQPEPENWAQICGLQLAGNQHEVTASQRHTLLARYLARYPFVAADAMLSQRLASSRLFCVTPTSLYLIDNRQGFAQRQQLL